MNLNKNIFSIQGVEGKIGEVGPQGIKGENGVMGPPGPAGKRGMTGPGKAITTRCVSMFLER